MKRAKQTEFIQLKIKALKLFSMNLNEEISEGVL